MEYRQLFQEAEVDERGNRIKTSVSCIVKIGCSSNDRYFDNVFRPKGNAREGGGGIENSKEVISL